MPANHSDRRSGARTIVDAMTGPRDPPPPTAGAPAVILRAPDSRRRRESRSPAPSPDRASTPPPAYIPTAPQSTHATVDNNKLVEFFIAAWEHAVRYQFFRPRWSPPRPNKRRQIPGLRRGRGSLLTNMVLDEIYHEPENLAPESDNDHSNDSFASIDYAHHNSPYNPHLTYMPRSWTPDPNFDYSTSVENFYTSAAAGAYGRPRRVSTDVPSQAPTNHTHQPEDRPTRISGTARTHLRGGGISSARFHIDSSGSEYYNENDNGSNATGALASARNEADRNHYGIFSTFRDQYYLPADRRQQSQMEQEPHRVIMRQGRVVNFARNTGNDAVTSNTTAAAAAATTIVATDSDAERGLPSSFNEWYEEGMRRAAGVRRG